jgi:hypothetical protein
MAKSWLDVLKTHVEKKPVVILRLSEADCEALRESRRGVGEFTMALRHAAFANVKAPTLCLLLAEADGEDHAYLGLIGSHSAITTLQSRVKVKRAVAITPTSPNQFVKLVDGAAHKHTLRDRLAEGGSITVLSPKLSGHLIERLTSVEANTGPMRTLAASLEVPRQFQGNGVNDGDKLCQMAA